MRSIGYLYGEPSFALMVFKNNRFVGIDLHLFRPELKLKKGNVYNIELLKNKIKIGKKIYKVYY